MSITPSHSAATAKSHRHNLVAVSFGLAKAQRFTLVPVLAAFSVAFAASGASAASFNFTNAQTAAQTLSANQTEVMASTGSMTVGGGTVAVTVNSNNASLNNQGSLIRYGTGLAISDNTVVTGLVVTNTDMSPVPLPPSVALLLAGIGCMGLLFQRRRLS